MPIRFTYLLITALLLVSAMPVQGTEKAITINYPPDKTVREYGLLGVSVNLSRDLGDRIIANVNSKKRATITPLLGTECFSVPLEPGINTVELIAYKGDDVVENIIFDVFRRSELISGFRNVPPGFKKDNFHSEDRKICTKCHILKPNVYDLKPVNPATYPGESFESEKLVETTSTCYSCHKKITAQSYVHGPASVWSCLSCHDDDTIPDYSVKTPDSELCYECHIDEKKDWLSKKYTHGPVTIGKCTICHSPHGSDNAFNLFKSTWDLCVNCHAAKADGAHVIADTLFKEGHPTRGRQDPLRVGKELTCASCHSAHASNYPHLWAFEVASLYELCQKCHKQYSEN